MKSLTVKGRNISCWQLLSSLTVFVLLSILFWCHIYGDLLVTTRHGINFWNILFDGQIHNFFHLNTMDSGNIWYPGVYACVYNILIYIVFAIWNIPLAILWKITSIDVMNNILCMAWAKLLPVTAAIVCAYIVCLILKDMGINKARRQLALYLMLSSATLLGSVFINSQYDTLGLIFQLLGLRSYLKKDTRGFLFWFGIAICFKLFALLIVVPLLLLREKKLSRLMVSMVILMIPNLLTTVPFFALDVLKGVERGDSITRQLLPMLFSQENQNGLFYWFIMAYGALMIWCYIRSTQEITTDDVLWTCFCAITSFFVLLNTHPYWIVLMVPYTMLVIVRMPNHRLPVLLLLETIGSCTLVVKMMRLFDWTYWGNTMKPMLLHYLFEEQFEKSVWRLYWLLVKFYDSYPLMVPSCVALAFTAMAWLTYPRQKQQKTDALVLDREIMALRFLVVSGVTLLPVLSLFL